MALSWLQLAPFVMEVYELTGTLLAHLDELERISVIRVRDKDLVDHQVSLGTDADQAALTDLLRSQVQLQTQLFDSVLRTPLVLAAALEYPPIVSGRCDPWRQCSQRVTRPFGAGPPPNSDRPRLFWDYCPAGSWPH